MTVKNLLIFAALISLLFGITLIFVPEGLAKIIFTDPTLTDSALATARNYGILLFAVGIASFSARHSRPSAARRGFLIQIAISGVLLTCYDAYTVFKGIDTNMGWGIVAITAILAIWGLLLLLKEKGE
jgi:hypothetical protein